MKYIKVVWFHQSEFEPIVLYSELNEDWYEIRKVEVFKDGTYGFASIKNESKNTRLGTVSVPQFSQIAEDGEFVPFEIGKDEFEEIWFEAVYSK